MLLCGLIIPIIVALVIPHHKQQVYMVPLIPTIILLISTVVSYLKINIRRILLILFIAVSFLQYIELSYGAKIWFCDYKFKFNDKFSFKYFNKYDDNIMFYDIKKRAPYVALLEYLKYTENKKTLILAENYENADYVLQTLRAFILLNGFDNIIVNSSILNLYLPVYSRDLMHYKFIIDLRTYNDFNREYGDLSDNINEHKYINNFYIPTKDEFLNKYNSFWAMYDKTEYSNINIKNMKIYKLKDTAL